MSFHFCHIMFFFVLQVPKDFCNEYCYLFSQSFLKAIFLIQIVLFFLFFTSSSTYISFCTKPMQDNIEKTSNNKLIGKRVKHEKGHLVEANP
jgi:hypothetical protein